MPRWIGLSLVVVLLFAAIYAIKGILLPFIAGLAVAYFLDPAADKLEAWGLPRWLATVVILVAFFILGTLLIALIWPLAVGQISGIAQAFPGYVAKIKPLILDLVDQAGPERAKELVSQLTGRLAEVAGNLAQDLISGGLALFNLISLLLITPVVAFYLLRDWDRMTAQIDNWLPRRYEPVIKDLLQQSDDVLAGFVRGQVLVVVAEAILYAAGWTMLGLEYGLILGILAGILAFVPFVGPLFAVGMSLIIAIGQFGDNYLMIGAVFSVFLFVQAIEGMVLQPRFIGERVGLHAVWVLLAVFAGGHVMGFVGVLIALPVAAVIAVLARFALKQYLNSDLYHDGRKTEDAASDVEQVQEVHT